MRYEEPVRHEEPMRQLTLSSIIRPYKGVFVLLIIGLSLAPALVRAKERAAGGAGSNGQIDNARHWVRPARATAKDKTASFSNKADKYPELYPETCNLCHPAKYEGWSQSLHSRSVGPGLITQLHPFQNPGFAASCYTCHAPLLEQSEVLLEGDGFVVNPLFDKKLQSMGVSCASCHMREAVIYGPNEPGRPNRIKRTDAGHNSKKYPLFSSSKFCAACHQLDYGYKLNGRVLTNTYNEWKESRYATEGVTCQKCHMPNRRHLWRGIHDPKMVLSGLDIKAKIERNSSNEPVSGLLTITSTGIGHMFPTYITPSVIVSGYLRDKTGTEIKKSRRSKVIGRRVALDLSVELFDTRIEPGKTFRFAYMPPNNRTASGAKELVFEIKVLPDEFYNRFFASMLNDGTEGSAKLKEAYRATVKSEYLLYRKIFSLNR